MSAALPATEIFKLLPLSILALRVTKTDPHEGHGHAPPAKPAKRTKGLWHVRIEQQQDTNPDLHYAWIYEGPQWRTKAYAGGALAVVLACVMHPLWPMTLRLGVWYLTMGMGALVALFFVMAFFRIILFLATVFTVPPGLWLYPNLFEDVGFFDSFRPVWGWQEVSRNLYHPVVTNLFSSYRARRRRRSRKGTRYHLLKASSKSPKVRQFRHP